MISKNREIKEKAVEVLSAELKASTSYVLVNYSGMGVVMQQELKKRLREAGAKMLVAKNTLFRIAATNINAPKEILDNEATSGQTALIVGSDDAVSPIGVLGKFIKEFELPKMKVGVVENVFQDEAGLVRLSKLPSKEVLYAQVVGGVGAGLYGMVGTLNANLQKLVYVLKRASEKEVTN